MSRLSLHAKSILLVSFLAGIAMYIAVGKLSLKKAAWNNLQDAFAEVEQQINQQLQALSFIPVWTPNAREAMILADTSPAPYTLWLYQGDSLLAWSKESPIFPGYFTDNIDSLPALMADSLAEGWYACWSVNMPSGYRLFATMPLSNGYLPLPDDWQFSSQQQWLHLAAGSGSRLCYIKTPPVWMPPLIRWLIVLMLGLLSLAGLFSATTCANNLVRNKKNGQGIALTGLTALGVLLGWQQVLSKTGWEMPVALWLIAALLLLWISAFVHRHHLLEPVVTLPGAVGQLLLTQTLCIGILWGFLYGWSRLLAGSHVYLKAGTIFELPLGGLGVIACGPLLALSVFVLTHSLQSSLIRVVKSLTFRLAASTVAAIVAALLLPSSSFFLSKAEIGLCFFLFLVFFDLYVDQETPGLIWLFVWTVLIAIFCAVFAHNITLNLAFRQDDSIYPGLMPLFSLCFSLLLGLVIGFLSLNYYTNAIPAAFIGFRPSLRNRLQLYFIVYTLLGFAFMGIVTGSYFQESTYQLHQLRRAEKINHLSATLRLLPPQQVGKQIPALAANYNTTLGIYSAQGILQKTATAPGFNVADLPPVMPPQLLLSDTSSVGYMHPEKGAFLPIADQDDKAVYYVGVKEQAIEKQLNAYFFPLLETFMTLYVFLLLASAATALAISNTITKPIEQIGATLSRVQLGQNEKLQWHTDDEIGELVAQYNIMIEKLEDSARQLKVSEREGAWREMAKQVAHEIKNPLTPMKLSVQLLQHAVKTRPEEANQLMMRTSQTLIEQIDNLARIAGEFSHFAQMPRPENDACNLNLILQAVDDLFSKSISEHGVTITSQLPDNPVFVFADRSQLLRVFNNLIKNAIQAIPADRQGFVKLTLSQRNDRALITVEDNGNGIPAELQERVFSPNFTTKSSGMGLGLAMSKNIVEAAGGQLYFHTRIHEGTTFFVEIPVLMKDEGL